MRRDAAVTIRLPAEVKHKLQARAERERRSLSSEIAMVLERSVDEEHPVRRPGRLLGLYAGTRVPKDEDFAEVRALLWGSLGKRRRPQRA